MTEIMLAPIHEATYRWDRARLIGPISYFGRGGELALGFSTHPNEPLSSALLSLVPPDPPFVCIRNLDPPPLSGAFPIPTDFFGYLEQFHLPPISQQVEYSHTAAPQTRSELRASELRKILDSQQIKKLLLFDNDPFADFPYFYSNREIPHLEKALLATSSRYFKTGKLASTPLTAPLSDLSYRYFPASKADPKAPSESIGLYLPRELNMEVITLELPLFHWGNCPPESKLALLNIHQKISQSTTQGSQGSQNSQNLMTPADRAQLVYTARREHPYRIPMIPASTTAEIQMSPLRILSPSAGNILPPRY